MHALSPFHGKPCPVGFLVLLVPFPVMVGYDTRGMDTMGWDGMLAIRFEIIVTRPIVTNDRCVCGVAKDPPSPWPATLETNQASEPASKHRKKPASQPASKCDFASVPPKELEFVRVDFLI